KAHKNMGIKGTGRYNNSSMKWQEREREHITEIAKKHNLEITKKNVNRKQFTVDEYKLIAQEVERNHQHFINKNFKNVKARKIPFTDKKILDSEDYEKLVADAKTNKFAIGNTGNIIKKFERKEEGLSELAESLKARSTAFEKAILQAEEAKEKYQDLYQDQLSINQELEFYKNKYKEIEPLKEQVDDLLQEKDDLVNVFANQMIAINLLVYDKKGYGLDLPKKQLDLIEDLESYSKGWLNGVGRSDLAKEVESKMGLSKGIQKEIKAIEREKNKGLDFSL